MAKVGSSVTLTEATASRWIPLDPHLHPFSVTYVVGVTAAVSGTVAKDVNVEVTLADVLGGAVPGSDEIWEIASAQSSNFNSTITNPVTAVRLNVTTLTTAGTAKLTVLQAGN